MDRPWPRIVALWLLGVLAAAQLAKFSTIVPLLRSAFGLTLPEAGLLISLLEVGGGLFGFAAGLALGVGGVRRFLLAGLAILVLASGVEAVATTAPILFVARAVEGIGYVLVVIAAPTAIAAIADDRRRGRALALWSSFVPVGMGVGSAVTALTVVPLGVSGVMLLWAALIALGIPVALRLPIVERRGQPVRLPAAAAWISTSGFGLYTLFLCAMTMLLPTYLVERHGAALGAAGMVAALASLAALPGSAIAMAAMRDGRLGGRRVRQLSAGALVATVPLVLLLYTEGGIALRGAAIVAMLVVMVSGLVPPLLFARLPVLAGATRPDDPRIATANGLLTQFGAGGALLGPPLGGLVVGQWGWNGLGIAISLLVVAMTAMVMLAEGIGPDRACPERKGFRA